jgi:hypothetical protein
MLIKNVKLRERKRTSVTRILGDDSPCTPHNNVIYDPIENISAAPLAPRINSKCMTTSTENGAQRRKKVTNAKYLALAGAYKDS